MEAKSTTFYLVRSYGAVVFGILIIAMALDSLLVWLGSDAPPAPSERYGGSFALIQQLVLEDPGSAGDVRMAFERRQAQLEAALQMPVHLYQGADFAGMTDFRRELRQGDTVTLYDEEAREILYRQVPDTDYILGLGPLPAEARREGWLERSVMIAYYLLVAFLLFLWIKPFHRDLTALKRAAGRFGGNDLSSRVEVSPNSSILPVARSFNTMAERIEYLISTQRDLTNAVSHELRTPLARFKFSLEILSAADDPDKKTEYLARMKQDVRELETLVDELLNYARLSQDNLALDRRQVHLRSWLETVVEEYEDAAIPPQVTFSHSGLDKGCLASFNPALLARAVHNVIRNGIRYARSAIDICVCIREGEVEIRICDDGPGVPPAMKEKIFEPFSRLETSRDRQSGGYGLGLAIARRIMERHGGSIHVENALPTGACFVLRWPAAHGC